LRLVFERLSTKRSNSVPIKEIIAACEQDECISDMLCPPEHGLERSQMVEQLFNTLRDLNSGRGSENLQRHISFQDMKAVCKSLRASAVESEDDELGLSDEEVQELRVLKFIFQCCDVTGDGLITSVELKSTCINYPEVAAFLGIDQHNPVRRVFQMLDLDTDGSITWCEFLSFVKTHRNERGISKPNSLLNGTERMMFDCIGANNEGKISMQEFASECAKNVAFAECILPSSVRGLRRQSKLKSLFNAIEIAGKEKRHSTFAEFESFIECVKSDSILSPEDT